MSVSIAGSTEMMPLLTALTQEFNRRRPHVLFNLRGGGSTLGERWVANRQIDLAASTLLYTDSELPSGVVRVPIGLDGIAIIVHTDNTVEELTLLQLRDLYSGRILDWQEVGGQSGDVLLVSREDGSGTRLLFEERTMEDERVALTAVVMPTSKDVVEYIGNHPQAIGYVSQSYTRQGLSATSGVDRDNIRVLRVEGTPPNIEAIAAQQYHLSRPLFLLRRAGQRGWPQQFIDFVLSPAGQEIVGRYHVRIR